MAALEYLPEVNCAWIQLNSSEVNLLNSEIQKVRPDIQSYIMDFLGFSGPDEEFVLLFKLLDFSAQALILAGQFTIDKIVRTNEWWQIERTFGITTMEILHSNVLEETGFRLGLAFLRLNELPSAEYERCRNTLLETTNLHLRDLNRMEIPPPTPYLFKDFMQGLNLD